MFGILKPPGRMGFDPTMPQPSGIAHFLRNAYETSGVDPRAVTYLDADASGNQVLEEAELAATDAVLGVGRDADHPLLVGSVKSNVGMTDAATGLVSISKLLIAMETGIIPATINCTNINPRLKGVAEGRLRITTQNVPITIDENTHMATTSLGLLGTVGHTVLRPNLKAKTPVDVSKELPRLVPISGRTEKSVLKAVEKVQATPYDPEYIRLVQDVFASNIRGHDYRSYVICPGKEAKTYPVQHMENYSVWFVYSGMGSEWAGMGQDLMRIPICADTIERLHKVLLTKGVDLKTILTERGRTAFDNILKSFVGIVAIQIALTNLLTTLEIQPDGIIGHSFGELGCSYADGCLTEEQTILAAYARGKASHDATLIPGYMAVVGIGYKDILPRLPAGVEVACHNSSTSCTLTGPKISVNHFVQKLKEQGVFARAVNVFNVAYHSQYIQPAGPFLLDYLKEIIPNPKPRSSKWISTSVPQSNWDTVEAKLCSAEYHTNNFLGSVLFEEGLQFIPQQAVLIEIAPHGLLQAILKPALPQNVHIPMSQRGAPDVVQVLLNSVGKMYVSGMLPKISALYPPVEFPVSRGTPSLAPLIDWYHDERSTFIDTELINYESNFGFSVRPDSPIILVGGQELLPVSELLRAVCEKFSQLKEMHIKDLKITFRDIIVEGWVERPSEGTLSGNISFLPETSRFEVTMDVPNGSCVVMSGLIRLQKDDCQRNPLPIVSHPFTNVGGEEVLADMAARGVAMPSAYSTLSRLQLAENDWIATMKTGSTWVNVIEDSLQITILRQMQSTQTTHLLRGLKRLDVDFTKILATNEKTARLYLPTNIVEADGLYMVGLSTEVINLQKGSGKGLNAQKYQFVPQGCTDMQSTSEFLALAIQMSLVADPALKRSQDVTVLDLRRCSSGTTGVIHDRQSFLQDLPGVQVAVVSVDAASAKLPTPASACLVVSGPDTLDDAVRIVSACGGLLLTNTPTKAARRRNLALLAEQKIDHEWLTLYKPAAPVPEESVVVHLAADEEPPNELLVSAKRPGVLVWRGEPSCGVHGAVKQVRKHTYAQHARMVFILDPTAPDFSLSASVYADQLKLGLPVNILRGGVWGSWRLLPLAPTAPTVLSTLSWDGLEVRHLGLNPRERQTSAGQEPGSGALDYVGVGPSGRVMGVARWVSSHSCPQRDPVLSWPVPESWTPEQAATVPYAYSTAIHALLTMGKLDARKSVLIHEGASSVGQAALRIATQMRCATIFATAANEHQRKFIIKTFPQLDPQHVLSCADLTFVYAIKCITKRRGVDVVLSALPGHHFKASLKCLALYGRFVHYGREDMMSATKFGAWVFVDSTAVFGMSGDHLFHARDSERALVAKTLQEGLDNGLVQPIIGACTFAASALPSALRALENNECTKVVLDVKVGGPGSRQCSPLTSYLLVGGSAAQWLQVAGWLSLNGAQNIVAAPARFSGDASLQRAKVLSDMFGAKVRVLDIATWDAFTTAQVIEVASDGAPLDAVIVFAEELESARVPLLLHAAMAGHRDAALLVLSTNPGVANAMSALCESRLQLGLRACCLVGPLHAAICHLSRALGGSMPAVTVLHDDISSQEDDCVTNSNSLEDLPRSGEALAALGKRLPTTAEPRLRDIQTRGLLAHQANEAGPVFAFPPLGVLAGRARRSLHTLASRLMHPLLCVEGRMEGDLTQHAAAVAKTIRSARPHGPYTLLGWSLSTPLTLQVARLLEEAGLRVVTFLVEGDVLTVREWARKLVSGPDGKNLISQLLSEDESCVSALKLAEEAKSWSSTLSQLQGSLPPSLAARGTHVQSALAAIRAHLNSIAQHELQVNVPVRGKKYVVDRNFSSDSLWSLRETDPNVEMKVLPKEQNLLGIAAPWFADTLNEFAACTKMVTDDEVRQMFF